MTPALRVLSAPEPKAYAVPQELVDRLLMASPKAHGLLVHALMRGAVLKPVATVYAASGAFVARVDFEAPILDGTDGLVLPLGIMTEG